MTTQIPWAPGAVYNRILCRLGEPRPDGQDSDEFPDLMTQPGVVTLTCSAKQIRYLEADGRRRILITRPWHFDIRAIDGELYNTASGNVGVYIISGESVGVHPTGFTWTAHVKPDNGDAFTVILPSTTDSVIDIASILP